MLKLTSVNPISCILTMFRCLCLNSVLYVKALVGFPPGEGPNRGLLCDCEIFGNFRITFVLSSSDHLPAPRHLASHLRSFVRKKLWRQEVKYFVMSHTIFLWCYHRSYSYAPFSFHSYVPLKKKAWYCSSVIFPAPWQLVANGWNIFRLSIVQPSLSSFL